jgi:hypothetical protein
MPFFMAYSVPVILYTAPVPCLDRFRVFQRRTARLLISSGFAQGSCIVPSVTPRNSGTHFQIYAPSESNLLLCRSGLTIRRHGWTSTPAEETKPHPPLLAAKSPSIRCSIKNLSHNSSQIANLLPDTIQASYGIYYASICD